ncbi:unnamed protein product [Paramecium octaurelia]|uniref:Uncharacterized protein n=1 Tax=Paramecium octaurelia TaxID=43137 RepID=A0A8S1YMF7_PAROT|nr:unnamed protein product [Paramecium octaurelia]
MNCFLRVGIKKIRIQKEKFISKKLIATHVKKIKISFEDRIKQLLIQLVKRQKLYKNFNQFVKYQINKKIQQKNQLIMMIHQDRSNYEKYQLIILILLQQHEVKQLTREMIIIDELKEINTLFHNKQNDHKILLRQKFSNHFIPHLAGINSMDVSPFFKTLQILRQSKMISQLRLSFNQEVYLFNISLNYNQ